MTCPLGISTRTRVSGTMSLSTLWSELLLNIPVAPESDATGINSVFGFLKEEGGSYLFSVIKLQDNKDEPMSHFLFLYTISLPPILFLAVAVRMCPSLGRLQDLESWLPVPWVWQ